MVFKIKYLMSLDFNLINSAVMHSQTRLQQADPIFPGVFFLDNFLLPDLLTKLQQRLAQPVDWISETTEDLQQAYPNRLKINWEAESVVEETHCVFDALTADINQLFGVQCEFQNITIWRDLPGYSIGWHQDNPGIALSLQIYLSDGHNLGTEFRYQDQYCRAQYQQNSGYAMNNQQRISHAMTTAVPENHLRTSVYAIWKNE